VFVLLRRHRMVERARDRLSRNRSLAKNFAATIDPKEAADLTRL
jgi:hypothetical protein